MFRFCLISFLSCLICGLVSPELSLAQEKKAKKSFNVEKFLKRLDANQNGKVEPNEVKDERTKSFLRKSGADPSKPINIKSFSKQIKKKRTERDNPGAGQRNTGFAVASDERIEATGDAEGFAVSDEEREPVERARNRNFSDGAKKMLDWVLKNYDKNKDGKIDEQEIKSGRWSDPPAHVSDTNKDGSLSRMELLVRYEERENRKTKKDNSRDDRRSRTRSRDRSRSSDSSSRSRRSSQQSSDSGDTKAKRDVRKGYESYVNGLFKNYDKDKDGLLDKDEIEKMRRKPDMKADENGDKKISKSELIDSYLEKAGHGKSKKPKSDSGSSKSSKSSRDYSRNRGSSPGAGSPNARQPLTDKDKNKNGQIEMSEFESNWTVEKIEAFYKKDKNKDGVITRAEWEDK